MVDEIEFWLYDPLNVTSQGKLEHSWARRWSDPLNDAGGGSFSIPANEPIAVAELIDGSGNAVYNQIVRCRLNGTDRFAWIVRENKKGTARAGEEVDRVLELAGPGTLAFFGSALVYPERGIGRMSPDNRLFNWTSEDYDDSAWVAATQVKQQSAVVTLNSWNGLPLGWADPTAYWIWDSSGDPDSNVADGDVYFRKTFTLAAPTTAVLSFTADDGADVYLDNARIANKDMDKGHSWPSVARVDLVLDAGPHLLAVKGSNVTLGSLPSGVLNIAGVLLALNVNSYGTTMPGNTDYGAVILHSDSSWLCLGYPPGGPPGMTPGEILRILFTEAQTRGALAGVTWSFTDANDSDGNPWTVIPDFGVPVGTTYYAVLRQLAEIACDLHMDPTSLELSVYNRRGSSTAVSLNVGVNVTDASHEGDGDLGNAALLRFTDGWREVISSASITSGGRFESFLSLGTAPSQEQGTLAAEALFADHANPRDAVVLTHEGRVGSGEEPYVDYDVGDTISVPSRDGVSNRSERVRAITVSEDAEGFPVYTPEVQALSAVLEERLQRWLKRMSAGTHAGQVENASPYVGGTASLEKAAAPMPAGAGFRYATVVVAASDSLNPADADLVCTGTNDHTTIIAALDLLPMGTSGAERGGRVLLMEGHYDIAARVVPSTVSNYQYRHITIEGQGYSTVLNLSANLGTGADTELISLQDMNGSCRVANLCIEGNGFSARSGVRVFANLGIGSSTRMRTPVVQNVRVHNLNCSSSGGAFTCLDDGWVIIDCQAEQITGDGIQNQGFAVISGCYIRDTTDDGIDQKNDGTGIITNCHVLNAGGTGIVAVLQSKVTNCHVTAVGPAIELETGAMVSNCDLQSSGTHTVTHTGTDTATLQGCTLRNPAGTSFDLVNCSGDHARILGNLLHVVSTQPRTGVRTETTADKTVILGNVFANVTTKINDLGTGTKVAYDGGALGDNASIAFP